MKNILLTCLCLPVVLLSCIKSSDKAPVTPYNLLVSLQWKPAISDIHGTLFLAENAAYYPVRLCETDDVYQFSPSGKLTVENGTTKCDGNEPATATSDYSVDIDKKIIVMKGVTYNLVEITADQMKCIRPLPVASGYKNLIYLFQPVK